MQSHYSARQFIVLYKFLELFLAIGARGNNDFCFRFLQLFGFDFTPDAHPVIVYLVYGHKTPTATAAVVLLAMWCHLYVITNKRSQDLTRLIDYPARPGDVARVMVRYSFSHDIRIEFDATFSETL